MKLAELSPAASCLSLPLRRGKRPQPEVEELSNRPEDMNWADTDLGSLNDCATTAGIAGRAQIEGILALRWRGSIEQRAVPGPNHRRNHRRRQRSRPGSEYNGRRNRGYRSSRVQHHAKRAVIAIRCRRMNVRNLHKGQQRQQQKTNQRSRAHHSGLAANHSP